VIATLGAVALEALSLIAYHEFKLKTHVGRRLDWNGSTLVPLYHPSPQVIAAQRGIDLQLRHFRTIGELIR
jgi:uracil-DNA glycosylase